MARPALINEAALIHAATLVAARAGPAGTSIAAVSKAAGVPTGSIYHRVSSRDALLAEVWLSATGLFQEMVLPLISAMASEADAIECALATPRFARSHHAAAAVLSAHRREEFIRPEAPDEYRMRAGEQATAIRDAIAKAAARLFPANPRGKEKLAVAVIGIPLGAVRVFLPQAIPPKEIDDTIAAAASAALRV